MTATANPTATEPLRARLRVEPSEAAGCAVLESGDRGEDVVWTDSYCGGEDAACRAAVTIHAGEERTREFVEGTVGEYCVCHAFREVECAADIERFCDGALVVSVTVPRREALRDLVAALREREATVHLEQVLPLAGGDGGRQLCLDAGAVTEKQREAIATAVDLGYYERPRTADLDAVADALGVSRSAASQRLNAAETTLIHALVETTDIEQVHEDASPGGAPGPATEEPIAD